MAAGEEKVGDFYAVLGLKKDCSNIELRNAYKKLAMRWHPDKCSASGNGQHMEEAKAKFQEIQKAYSVLSDSSKRFLYDVGVYDNEDDDDENQGMGDFLGEMAQMMRQNKSNEGGGHESFEELQRLFVELFDPGAGFSGGSGPATSSAAPSSFGYSGGCGGGSSKRDSSAMNSGKTKLDDFGPAFGSFCHGLDEQAGQSSKGRGGEGDSSSKRRHGRKQKISSKHDVSSCDT